MIGSMFYWFRLCPCSFISFDRGFEWAVDHPDPWPYFSFVWAFCHTKSPVSIMSCALHMRYPGSIIGYISRKLTVSQILGCDSRQKFKCKLATKRVSAYEWSRRGNSQCDLHSLRAVHMVGLRLQFLFPQMGCIGAFTCKRSHVSVHMVRLN